VDGHASQVGPSAAGGLGGPPAETDVEVTEDGIARAFTAQFRDVMRYDHSEGRWYEWAVDRWRPDVTQRAQSAVRDLAREASADADSKIKAAARKSAFIGGAEKLARSDPAHAVTHAVWDRDVLLLGAPGLTIDLRSVMGRKPDPLDGITKLTAVAPAAVADCPQWLAFLDQATGGDADMIRFLQQWCGYCLTGDTSEHALLFVYGPGGNGKSVFLNTVTGILGDYATTASMDAFTASKSDRHPTDLAMLRGARLVSASETEQGRPWAESRIKQLTGGDRVSARFMRQDFFTYLPQFKLIVVGNHQPVLHNVDDAARRRFNIVPFVHKPAAPDRGLEAKLRAEWPAILRWMIDGYEDWRKHGLLRPAVVHEATEAYFADQDLFGQWLDEACIVGPGRQCTAAELFDSWRIYAMRAGDEPGSQKKFAENMRNRGFARYRDRRARGYVGLNLVRSAARYL
jgi:putative DNA primase/helicase